MLLIEKFKNIQNLSSAQQSVINFLIDKKQAIEHMTIKDIAQEVYTSPATLIRLAKNLGYDGFEQLKYDFLQEQIYLNSHFENIDANIPFSQFENVMSVAGKISMLAKETIDDTLSLLNYHDLNLAVKIISKARKIHISAISFPLIYSKDFQLKMRRIGKNVEITDLVGEQLYTAPIINKDDCAIIISYSGEIPLLTQMLDLYKKLNIPIVSITSVGSNTIRSNANISLSLTTREKLYSKIAGYSNEFSTKLILDILYSCCFQENYTENFESKKLLSTYSEPGRFSDSTILKES